MNSAFFCEWPACLLGMYNLLPAFSTKITCSAKKLILKYKHHLLLYSAILFSEYKVDCIITHTWTWIWKEKIIGCTTKQSYSFFWSLLTFCKISGARKEYRRDGSINNFSAGNNYYKVMEVHYITILHRHYILSQRP